MPETTRRRRPRSEASNLAILTVAAIVFGIVWSAAYYGAALFLLVHNGLILAAPGVVWTFWPVAGFALGLLMVILGIAQILRARR